MKCLSRFHAVIPAPFTVLNISSGVKSAANSAPMQVFEGLRGGVWIAKDNDLG